MEYDKNQLSEKISIIKIEKDKIDSKTLFEYKIFPDNILTHLTDWKLNTR